ncbi:MAG: GGDEF domain-containing protein [Planctomycetota bacterium]
MGTQAKRGRDSRELAAWTALDELSAALDSIDLQELDLERLATCGLRHIGALAQASRGSIYVADSSGSFQLAASSGAAGLPQRVYSKGRFNGGAEEDGSPTANEGGATTAQIVDPVRSLMMFAAQRRQPLLIADVGAFRTEQRMAIPEHLSTEPASAPALGDSCIIVPLLSHDHLHGVLNLSGLEIAPPAPETAAYRALLLASRWLSMSLATAQHVLDLRTRATRDSLTGLFNYATFYDLLAREVLRAERYVAPTSLIMLDLDSFKAVNDHYGHLAGDAVLCGVANQIRSALRAADVAARYAGDEFSVVLPQTGRAGALRVADRIRENIESDTFTYLGTPVPVTVSIGVAELERGMTAVDLVRKADDALYRAKGGGRNCVRG